MLKKLANTLKSFFSYPKELKEMELRAKETNQIYQSALKKANVSPNKAVWDKDFKAEDVAKALDKQAPKPKEKKVATKPGLYANIHAKRERIEKQKAEGKPVETMRKPGTKGAPTAKAFKESAKTATKGKK
jgi:hypothetical protein